ncbi:Cation/H(+) antiporter like [Quillaja saponaria]|uniref:Cation/H(+) antiporter like n=1 Tax=Quillaja saponaria TaxID=32244 RepID=A0AAD7L5S4_QUISA|nr:Cation/H(+) antiporter like [Quillaja saponaria]
MELTERSSAILMVHKARKNGLPFWNKRQQSDGDQIVVAFEAFQQLSRVSIRPMTAISAMLDIHEDICSCAERKRAAMIILPFHKHQRFDGTLETTRTEFRLVNRRVLEHAPCSVGILVDRGLGGSTHVSARNFSSEITVLFFGGRDDHEAVSYGLRMSEHPGINLTIVQFLAISDIPGDVVSINVNYISNTLVGSSDETFVAEIKQKISNNSSIKFEEKAIQSAAEIVDVVRLFSRCNLFVVGRMQEGQVTGALNMKGDCPELGPVGNLLTSPDFSTSASVLVVQQYNEQKNLNKVSSKVVVLSEEDSETE